MTRVEDGLTYTQTFDAENRLVSVTVNNQTTQFVYDGDGNMVKKINPDGSRTIYIGGVYEVRKNSSLVVIGSTTYYPAAGAMRVTTVTPATNAVYYVLADQLGSTSVVTDAGGAVVGTQGYYPFGETRLSTGSLFTDRLYTGQQENSYIKLVDLRSRMYSPSTGTFLTRDTWQGDYKIPLSLNRWNYVEGDPVNFTDPSGFVRRGETKTADAFVQDLQAKYQVRLLVDWGPSLIPVPTPPSQSPNQANTACDWREGDWTIDELHTLWSGVVSLSFLMGGPNKFIANTGGVTVWQGPTKYLGLTHAHNIEFTSFSQPLTTWTVVHEFGHAWDANFNWNWSLRLEDYTGGYTNIIAAEYEWKMGKCDMDKILHGQRVPGQRLPGCNNAGYFYGGIPPAGSDANFTRQEDFAESVAAAVFPFAAQAKVQPYYRDPVYGNLYYSDYTKTPRWYFIQGVIAGTIRLQ